MSPLATLTAAWTAVYAYLCAYYSVLYARRRAEREYLAFGLLSGAMAIYTLGGCLFVDATSLAQAAYAHELQLFGMLAASAFAVDFAHHMTGRQSTRATRVVYGTAIAFVFANVAHLLVDVTSPPDVDTFTLFPSDAQYAPHLTGLGGVAMATAMCAVVYATLQVAWRTASDPDLRIVLGGAIIVLLTGAHDLVVRITPVRSIYLLEHGYMLFALSVSYVLL
ncbi:MAG: Flagellar sensor histidine kinase FleS, partial [Myxococcaceae bacterium]|nr:Flagellar sensor histidine kinase FleS [Myxococcaceae bacterium]